ncbi:response regulator transcription factor [Paenibacillus albiflavus]|uniref:Response regulator transcription factor n=1 Tax=Paenibacillus albiflavus TaxID=2545760 RepID=A0A4R4EBI2_9BACL|nr:response regulator transcription factor [Paenibacillus albiflavus]TCZ77246.1 response regulator transcription factor [Paenibacillus albiflavus]
MTRETILLVDDEKEIVTLMEIYLKNEGYLVLKASDGIEALEQLQAYPVDLIVLDVMMPRMDGLEACIRIRQENHIPIIMVSAKAQDMDKISGLSIGADDYVEKPFNPLVLVAKVKSQLRRYKQFNTMSHNDDRIIIDDLVIYANNYKVTLDGVEVKLTPREFAILRMLAVNRGMVLSMEQIYREVWNEPFMESKNTVMVHIRKIREKIEPDSRNPKYIETVWGIGYKIEK